MLDELKKETNKTLTENGCVANKTTFNSLLDMFAQGGSMRNRSEQDIVGLFMKAFSENELTATKMMFWLRDVRGGAGERRTFRAILKWMAMSNPKIVNKNIDLIPEFGRWDDLLTLIGTKCEKNMVEFIKEQLRLDYNSENPSLLAKWLPSANASSKNTRGLAKKIIKLFETNEKDYRKLLSKIRAKLNLIETKMSNRKFSLIDYAHIPSKAGMKYRQSFFRNDEKRYTEFLESLKKGTTTVNSKTLYPYEIVNKIIGSYSDFDDLYDGMWKNLPDYTNGKFENSMAVVDVSGSMNGTPMEVAISLGIYISERNKGKFHNNFITFSENPNLVTLKGNTITQKVRNMSSTGWGMSTNLESVFDLILDTCIKYNLPQDEMVKKLYIFTDMNFNQATKANKTLMETVKKKYKKAGYKLPKIVFWNLDARNEVFPCTVNDLGVQLVSGFSPVLFKNLMQDKFLSPVEMMMDILNQERYSVVKI